MTPLRLGDIVRYAGQTGRIGFTAGVDGEQPGMVVIYPPDLNAAGILVKDIASVERLEPSPSPSG